MVPRSRSNSPAVHAATNIIMLTEATHRAWHLLFSNMTPFEVVVKLIQDAGDHFDHCEVVALWAGCISRFGFKRKERAYHPERQHALDLPPKQAAAWNYLFGACDIVAVLCEVVSAWAPRGYFSRVEVVATDGARVEFSSELEERGRRKKKRKQRKPNRLKLKKGHRRGR